MLYVTEYSMQDTRCFHKLHSHLEPILKPASSHGLYTHSFIYRLALMMQSALTSHTVKVHTWDPVCILPYNYGHHDLVGLTLIGLDKYVKGFIKGPFRIQPGASVCIHVSLTFGICSTKRNHLDQYLRINIVAKSQ